PAPPPPAHHPGLLRGSRKTGAAGDPLLRAVSAGVGPSRSRGARAAPRRAASAGIEAAPGEEPGAFRPDATARQTAPAGGGAPRRLLPGPQGERARLWQSRQRQAGPLVRALPGAGTSRPPSAVFHLQLAGPGTAARQARPEAGAGAQAAGEV